MTIDPQGQKASLNGAKFEDLIEHAICDTLSIKSAKHTDHSVDSTDILWKNVPYESIYGTKCRSEFVLRYRGRNIRIECKSQESPGSVDEKFPYLVENFTKKVPEEETIIITNGEGFRQGALHWMQAACEGTKCTVHTASSFIFWLHDLLGTYAYSKQE